MRQPTHILIPWFVDVKISQQSIVDSRWTIAQNEASHLVSSAKPGENGNIIIYGHNTRAILGNIRALKGGEIATLTSADGQQYHYRITEIMEVKPDEVEHLLPTKQEMLTIYTCSGFLDSMRFIVKGERYE